MKNNVEYCLSDHYKRYMFYLFIFEISPTYVAQVTLGLINFLLQLLNDSPME